MQTYEERQRNKSFFDFPRLHGAEIHAPRKLGKNGGHQGELE